MDKVDCLVIGAGMIGLAVARALARTGREVFVAEKNPAIGMETSARNSEVIHAGLYYPTGSLKARLCLEGREALYAYCDERGIPYRQCGKLIVATSESQIEELHSIRVQAHANGCAEVEFLSRSEVAALEPALNSVAAIHSPRTGIIDSHAYMLALQADAEHAGAACGFDTRLVSGHIEGSEAVVQLRSGDGGELELAVGRLINCAGLWAPATAKSITGLDSPSIPAARFAKGNYFSLAGKSPFSRLIYPVPEPGGLGVHLTLDLGGQARFGPDVEWLDIDAPEEIDYAVDPRRGDAFYSAIRRYWPDLPDAALQPAYAGMRPKLADAGPSGDFRFLNHGCDAYLGLYGMESPGLTASLAIARHVGQMLHV